MGTVHSKDDGGAQGSGTQSLAGCGAQTTGKPLRDSALSHMTMDTNSAYFKGSLEEWQIQCGKPVFLVLVPLFFHLMHNTNKSKSNQTENAG